MVMLALAAPGSLALIAVECSADPCAETFCSPSTAAAYANGSESAYATASSGGSNQQGSAPNGGTAHAEATGTGPSRASASAERAFSTKDAYSNCYDGGQMMTVDASIRELVGSVGIGCVADNTITRAESFHGRAYVGPLGGIVLYDAARGEGLVVGSLEVRFSGASLEALRPLDIADMQQLPLEYRVETMQTEAGRSCSASLNA